MAQTIGGSPQQPIRRTPTPAVNQQQNMALEQQLLKDDIKSSQDKASVTIGRQNTQTKEDKKLTDPPKERVTLSSLQSETVSEKDSIASEKAEVRAEEPAAGTQTAQAPAEKGADELAGDFLSTFASVADKDDMKAISQKTQESMGRLAQMGAEVNEPAVLAAETYNYAKSAISAKMPNATQAEIREAAKSDPEIAKNVQLLDATSNYLTSLKKLNTGQGTAQQPEGAAPNAGPAAAGVESPGAGTGPMGANPFATMGGQQGGMPPGQGPGGPGGPGDGVPFYHKTPEEQARLIQERNSEMNEIMKIYAQMAAERQKTMAQIHQIYQETNQSVMEILQNVWLTRARSASNHMNNVRKLIMEAP